jgi:hypothetical protein
MVNRIRYVGHRNDGTTLFIEMSARAALDKGVLFETNGYSMKVSKLDLLNFYMHKHCPYLDVKMQYDYELTIREMYKTCPTILLELLKAKGGVDFLAEIIVGCEELYNQEQIMQQWLNVN